MSSPVGRVMSDLESGACLGFQMIAGAEKKRFCAHYRLPGLVWVVGSGKTPSAALQDLVEKLDGGLEEPDYPGDLI